MRNSIVQQVRDYEEHYLAVWREQTEAAAAAAQPQTIPGMLPEAAAILEAPASACPCSNTVFCYELSPSTCKLAAGTVTGILLRLAVVCSCR